MRRLRLVPAALAALLLTASASAAPILAGSADPGFDAGLSALATAYQRQQDVFAARPFGMSLDPVFKPETMETAKAFFAQSDVLDYEVFSGMHPYDALVYYDEYGDEGNFAGVASVGVAARLLVLRAEGASEAELAPARDAAVSAARAWHVYAAIGGPGVVARGVRRVAPWVASDPPFPGAVPDLVPLADASGPLPADKKEAWRAPIAPGFEGWIWLDDTSKDQVSGYALAAAYLWDALHDDPAVDTGVTADLAKDLTAFAKGLMQVAPELGIDLCIRDGDGRLTTFHDLNARQLDPNGVLPEGFALQNGFNAALALGIVRAAYHAGGDEEVGRYYYEDLVGRRDYPAIMAKSAGLIYLGQATSYSNVNMLTIALATLGRTETDPYVRQRLSETLSTQYWSTGSDRDASHVGQAWYDAVYGGFGPEPPASLRSRVTENLGGFQAPPAFQRQRVNCDQAEIAAKHCVGIDDVTEIDLIDGTNVLAKDVVPMSIRPDSDFAWRTDPREVNGGASTKMDPGGDFLAAYWAARLHDLDDEGRNVSPVARPALPYDLGGGGGGGAGGGASAPQAEEASDEGCGCRVGGVKEPEGLFGWAAPLAALLVLGRRRQAARR